jgi:hypothetical protein
MAIARVIVKQVKSNESADVRVAAFLDFIVQAIDPWLRQPTESWLRE